MIRIWENAEQYLAQKINEWRYELTQLRCAALRLSEMTFEDDEQREAFYNALYATLKDQLADPAALMLRLQDGDVLLISKTLHRKLITQAFAHPQLVPWPVSIEILAFLYEIDRERDAFLGYVAEKMQLLLERQKQAEDKARLEQKQKEERFLSTANDPKLRNAIRQRRQLRNHAEVLIIEDDEVTRKMVESALSYFFAQKDISIELAHNGKTALQKYVQHAPNMIFLDIGLPDFNGHEIMQAILAMDNEAYIVMLSGQDDKGNILRAIEHGAKGFVGKPFKKDKLAEYVQNCPSIRTHMQA